MNTKKIYFAIGLLSMFLFYLVMHFVFIPNDTPMLIPAHIVFLFGPFLAAYECYKVTRTYGENNIHKDSFQLMLYGFISIFIGNLVTVILKYFYKITVYPSPADFFYILGYPFVGIGLFKEIVITKIYSLKKSEKTLIYIIFPVIIFLLFMYLFYNSDNSIWQNILNIFYRYSELIIAIGIVIMARIAYEYRSGKMFYPWLLLSIGGALFISVGVLYNFYWQEFKAYIFPYSLLNAIWLLAYLFIAYGMNNIHDVLYQANKSIVLKMKVKKML